jgi:hypothetical protein
MRRFLFVAVVSTSWVGAALVVAACSSTASWEAQTADAAIRRDGGPVEAPDAGVYDGGAALGPEPSCTVYCGLVMESCKGDRAQYSSRDECLALCARLPPGAAGDTDTNTLACRQYYAGSPALTDAVTYCLAAGPFGGGVCGDRCTAFCGLTLGACPPATPRAPYASTPDCQTACAGYPYRDGGVEGGGEPPDGPASGDTLNCRLFHARSAVQDGSGCVNVGPDSGACR